MECARYSTSAQWAANRYVELKIRYDEKIPFDKQAVVVRDFSISKLSG